MTDPVVRPVLDNNTNQQFVFYHSATLATESGIRPLDPFSSTYHLGPLYIGMPEATSQSQMLYVDDAALDSGQTITSDALPSNVHIQRTLGKNNHSYLVVTDVKDQAFTQDLTVTNTGGKVLAVNSELIRPGETFMNTPATKTKVQVPFSPTVSITFLDLPPKLVRISVLQSNGDTNDRSTDVLVVSRPGFVPTYSAQLLENKEVSSVDNTTTVAFQLFYADDYFILLEPNKTAAIIARPVAIAALPANQKGQQPAAFSANNDPVMVPLYGGGIAVVTFSAETNTYTITYDGSMLVNSTPLVPMTITTPGAAPVVLYSGQRTFFPSKLDLVNVQVNGHTVTGVAVQGDDVTQYKIPRDNSTLVVVPSARGAVLSYHKLVSGIGPGNWTNCADDPQPTCTPGPGPATSFGNTRNGSSSSVRADQTSRKAAASSTPVYVWVLIAAVIAGIIAVVVAVVVTGRKPK